MIAQLIQQQVPKHRDKWLKIGFSTTPGNKKVAWKAVKATYRMVGLQAPTTQVWLDSPYHGVWGAYFLTQMKYHTGNQIWNYISSQIGKKDWNQTPYQIRSQIWNQVKNKIWDHIWNQLTKQIIGQIGYQIENHTWYRIKSQIENRVRTQIKIQTGYCVPNEIWNQDKIQIKKQIHKQIHACGRGSQDALWLSFFDFLRVCGIQPTHKLAPLYELSLHVGWWWPFENLVLFTPKPSTLHTNEFGLHCHGGPALDYEGSWKIFALNGVRVPEWLAMQTSSELNPIKLFDIENAEIRREFVRKIGMERLCYSLGAKEIDVWEAPIGGKYTLLELDVKGRIWKFLKMQNPSIGIWHVEGVPNECETVYQALNFRNGLTENQIDDENGANWYQQGDVILRPKGASKYKRLPVVLT